MHVPLIGLSQNGASVSDCILSMVNVYELKIQMRSKFYHAYIATLRVVTQLGYHCLKYVSLSIIRILLRHLQAPLFTYDVIKMLAGIGLSTQFILHSQTVTLW